MDGTLQNRHLAVLSVVRRWKHAAKRWQDFAFLASRKTIVIERWGKVAVHFDGPDNGKVCHKQTKKSMAMKRHVKSTSIGSASAGYFDCASNSWCVIWLRKKVKNKIRAKATIKGRCAEGRTKDGTKEWLFAEILLEKWNEWRNETKKMFLRPGRVLVEKDLFWKKQRLRTLAETKPMYVEQTYYSIKTMLVY